jgi:histidinol-phosphate aminotransferase
MSRLWSDLVHRLSPYVPGEQPKQSNLVKLNTNENPYPPSPAVLEAIRAELGDDGARLRLYPDPQGSSLREAIARNEELDPAQVFVGNGSDEVLGFAFRALFAQREPLRFPDISYSFYPSYCRLFDIRFETVAVREDGLRIEVDDFPAPGPVILPNPNAPTGRALPRTDIARLLAARPDSPVIIDEAYVDFGTESSAPLIARHDNLLVVRTMSKSHALAGLRVGYALGHPALIEALTRVKDSFNSYPLDRLALAAASAAIGDTAWLDRTRAAVIASREQLSASLAALGFEVLPSQANFVFARHPGHDAAALAQGLRDRGIIVRHFSNPRIAQWLRITVGLPEQCRQLVEALSLLTGRR